MLIVIGFLFGSGVFWSESTLNLAKAIAKLDVISCSLLVTQCGHPPPRKLPMVIFKTRSGTLRQKPLQRGQQGVPCTIHPKFLQINSPPDFFCVFFVIFTGIRCGTEFFL